MKRIAIRTCLSLTLGVVLLWGTAGVLLQNNSFAYADEKATAKSALTTSTDVSNLVGKWEKWPSGWYFKKKDGTYATGLFSPKGDSRWYYCNAKGLMKTGWVKTGGKWYYAQSNGAMASGWKKIRVSGTSLTKKQEP